MKKPAALSVIDMCGHPSVIGNYSTLYPHLCSPSNVSFISQREYSLHLSGSPVLQVDETSDEMPRLCQALSPFGNPYGTLDRCI